MRDTSPCRRHGVVFDGEVSRNADQSEAEFHHLDRFKPSARLKTVAKPK